MIEQKQLDRQIEVLVTRLGSTSNQETAAKLGISPRTVKSHLRELIRVLQSETAPLDAEEDEQTVQRTLDTFIEFTQAGILTPDILLPLVTREEREQVKKLTKMQRKVMEQLLIPGANTESAIADMFSISESTVKFHMRGIRTGLGFFCGDKLRAAVIYYVATRIPEDTVPIQIFPGSIRR